MTYFRHLGQKSKNNFIHFLVQMRTSKFASEIYWPLADKSESKNIQNIWFMWLVREWQIHGGNFNLIGHVTSLIPCKNSSHYSVQERINTVQCACWLPVAVLSWGVLGSLHERQKVPEHMLLILAAHPGQNGQLSCLHTFKNFWPMKPSFTSNEMTLFAAHFDV